MHIYKNQMALLKYELNSKISFTMKSSSNFWTFIESNNQLSHILELKGQKMPTLNYTHQPHMLRFIPTTCTITSNVSLKWEDFEDFHVLLSLNGNLH